VKTKDYNKVTLADLGDGAMAERFDRELQRVIENIQDLNTTDGKRKITMTLELKPLDDTRDNIAVQMKCTSTLAPYESTGTMFFLDVDRSTGEVTAFTRNPNQTGLFDEDKDVPDNTIPMNQQAAGGQQ
jgi:hypothetical protein